MGKDGRYKTWDDARQRISIIADGTNEYCGIPTPLEGQSLITESKHTAKELFYELGRRNKPTIVGQYEYVNWFYSHKLASDVAIWKAPGWTKENPKIEWGVVPGVNHFDLDLQTMGCSVVWSMEAECRAMEKLRKLITGHLFDMYFLTGMFLETSKRSGVTYVFRRLRPTVALRPSVDLQNMHILCCLCLHPIGYYENTWAGSMVPTDDVIAHLLMMRGDEPYYWRKANQIRSLRATAGL